jgi:uncharacterized tellurite resistance protein B-like protein
VKNERIAQLYANVAVHANADREHQAAVELLLLVMMSDHHVGPDEIDEIRTISEDSGFETHSFSFDQYLGIAIAKVRAAIADDDVEGLLDSIDGRINSSVLRQSLFSAARDVAGVDHEIAPDEESILAQIAARFD